MRHYQTDEFIYDDVLPDPISIAVDKKVSLLYDLCILCKDKKSRDEREAALRDVLSHYKSESALTSALHDVVLGNKSIDTFLEQKCYNENNKGVM